MSPLCVAQRKQQNRTAKVWYSCEACQFPALYRRKMTRFKRKAAGDAERAAAQVCFGRRRQTARPPPNSLILLSCEPDRAARRRERAERRRFGLVTARAGRLARA